MEQKINFSLKTVTEKPVYKAICSLKKKKGDVVDGISKEQLVLAAKVLVLPLTRIINNSIINCEFPEMWKEALSCSSEVSKVLEKLVCDQVTHCMEMHKLLPENQHGFRQERSTMNAARVHTKLIRQFENRNFGVGPLSCI